MGINTKNQEIIQQRVNEVSDLLLDGLSRYEICQTKATEWDLSFRQIDRYIKKAHDKFSEIHDREFKNNVNWHLIARRRLYKYCIRNEDIANARNILKDIAELQGLYTQNVKVSGEKNNPIQHQLIINRYDRKRDKSK